jgi:outer membrane biosynthesis protein TonB
LIATITPQGKAESVCVVSSPSPAFTEAAIETLLRGWRFRPAVGIDGKAFATRVDLEVSFPR